MNELVKITEKDGQQVVSARELHEFLESERQFGNWIKERIEKYDFIENQDYSVFNNSVNNPKGGRTCIEYALTLDCAKELAMVEGNEKGKQARKYFIECEKKLKEVHHKPVSQVDLFKQISNVFEEQQKQIDNLGKRVFEIEEAKVEAEKCLQALPKPSVKVEEKTTRQALNKLINLVAVRDHLQYYQIREALYKEFSTIYHVNVRLRASKQNMKQIDWIESHNYIEELYSLAVEMFMKNQK